jgi:hypothetical protein
MRRKKLDEAIESFGRDLKGHSLSSLDSEGVFLFINDDFPIIVTASRAEPVGEPRRREAVPNSSCDTVG